MWDMELEKQLTGFEVDEKLPSASFWMASETIELHVDQWGRSVSH
jgi:hypothetical protein